MKENGKAAIQRDLARLEELANWSLMKFSEDKCKVLHLGRKKPWQKYRLSFLMRVKLLREQHGLEVPPRLGS